MLCWRQQCKLSKPRSSNKAFQDIKDKEFEWNLKKRETEEKGSLTKSIDNMQIEGIKHQDLECNNNQIKSVGLFPIFKALCKVLAYSTCPAHINTVFSTNLVDTSREHL